MFSYKGDHMHIGLITHNGCLISLYIMLVCINQELCNIIIFLAENSIKWYNMLKMIGLRDGTAFSVNNSVYVTYKVHGS